ncbi:MAG TPA: redoxin domain-containing protein [Planctomycetota bacterium]|nr:redoxin domain-containing protein [Planctomycetota bacterium]
MRRALVLAVLCVGASAPRNEKAQDFTLNDPAGKAHTLYGLKDSKATVLVFLGIECPMVARYGARLADLHAAWAPKGVSFLGIHSNAGETAEAVAAHAKRSGYSFPVLLDPRRKTADGLKVDITPTAVVLDAAFFVKYRGAIDDHKSEDRVKSRYLSDAIASVVEGRDVAVAETTPVGCAIQRRAEAAADGDVTYAGQVADILNRRCVTCHRAGQVAPFSLTTYEQASRWSRDIKRATKAKTMPPWMPANHGEFRDERWLSDAEIDTLARWCDTGAPLGDKAKVPTPPKFPEGWMLGEPDLVLTGPDYEVGPTGPDEYRCYVLPTDLPEDRWVSAVEVRPGNMRIVHHIIAYVDTSGLSEKLDADDAKPGYRSQGTGPGFIPSGEMSGWAPGVTPYALPEGVGRQLRKGARIVLEVHYHKNGRVEKDRATIGLHFSKKPVRQPLRWITPMNAMFVLKPGEKRIKVTASQSFKRDVKAISIFPHMHLLGREMTAEALLPDGTRKTLIHVPAYDFNWQDTYHFKEPIPLPAGTKIEVTAYYDNSADNPDNPHNPPKAVRWGEQTTDEMCILFLSYIRDESKD